MNLWSVLVFAAVLIFVLAVIRTWVRVRARLARHPDAHRSTALMRALGAVMTDPAHIGDRRVLGWALFLVIAALIGSAIAGSGAGA